MRQPSHKETSVTRPDQIAFFCAANGFSGFRSHHAAHFAPGRLTRLYLIRGGPGTGKSRLIADVARAAEENGATATYYRCSSDPASYDGVILEKGGRSVAFFDATAPHPLSPVCPGAEEECVDLGRFWDDSALTARRTEIRALAERKADAYARAYRYLKIAGDADEARAALLDACVDRAKLRRAVARESRLFRPGDPPDAVPRYLTAFGMSGRVRLTTWQENATVISVTDPYGAARLFLGELARTLETESLSPYYRIPSCFSDGITEGVYLPRNNLLFLEDCPESATRQINMFRFLFKEKLAARRPEIRRADALRRASISYAEEALREAGTYHFALEKIYGSAMDFPQKEACCDRIRAQALALLDGKNGN